MITGQVRFKGQRLYPIVTLRIHGADGVSARVESTIDTGFTEQLTLRLNTIEALGLTREANDELKLANGHDDEFDVYLAEVEWLGQRHTVAVHRAECDPLIGMGLLQGNNLHIQAIHGGDVSIAPIDQ